MFERATKTNLKRKAKNKREIFDFSSGHRIKELNRYFIYGGAAAGSAGCIDLWENNNRFFKVFLGYVEKYKNEILKNQGKIPLIVKYEDSTKVECDNVVLFNRSIDTKYCKSIGKESK